MSAGHPGLKRNPKAWARRMVLAEIAELAQVGLACNAQHWSRVGVKKDVAECRAAQREARRLLRVARTAVERA